MSSTHAAVGAITSRHKSRRSWFDTPPLTTLDQIPSQKLENVSKRQSLDAVESLTLTHFTNPPRIIFGKTLIGKIKFRTLLLRNPHDFEQEVIIERFPYKKKFMVNQTRFTVGPEDVFSLQITWTPEEAGGYREMIQFYINDVYRLQAFVIGTAEKPKAPRKIRKFPLAPCVKHPSTVVQTPALSNIRINYSPTSRQEAHEVMEDLASHHSDNKENSRDISPGAKCQTMNYQKDRFLKLCGEPPRNETVAALTNRETQMKAEEEIVKTPTPLESTTIVNKHDCGQVVLKNRRQWRNIADITSPTLNMSPIPVNEGNEHGITIDSYFQPNETSSATLTKSKKQKLRISGDVKKNPVQRCSEDSNKHLKGAFVVPLPPADGTKILNKLDTTENSISMSSENRTLVTSVGKLNQQTARADETHVIKQHQTVIGKASIALNNVMPEKLPSEHSVAVGANVKYSSINSPPKIPRASEVIGTNQVSPRTMLDQSLTLISQMVPARSTEISPKDSNTSINSSLISQGQGIVSPNSFMEDMRSMVQNGCGGVDFEDNNTSTPGIPKPSLIFNSSISHNVMVSHLQSIKLSLHEKPLDVSSECGTPKRSQRARVAPKRRSISSQFQKEEMRKIAARAVKKDNELSIGDHRKHLIKNDFTSMVESLMAKRQSRGTLLHSQKQKSPLQGNFISKKKVAESKKAAVKQSPKGRRSPLSRKSPLVKKFLANSTQDYAIKRVKKSRKKSSPLKVNVGKPKSNKFSTRGNDHMSEGVLTNISGIASPNDNEVMFSLVTPQKDNQLFDSRSTVTCRSIDSGTVVKSKSIENTADNSGRFFGDLFLNEDKQSEEVSEKSSSMRREKLFPDIHNCESDEICHLEKRVDAPRMSDVENKKSPEVVICKSETTHKHSGCTDKIIHENNIVEVHPRDNLERIVDAAERSMSPNRFCVMSPSNLPVRHRVCLEHSKRGTITLAKSRPSDALFSNLSNRNNMLQDSPKKSFCCIKEDDTETQENITVRVEEHYEEVDGNMYIVVKETTDVIRSTTDTYIEHIAISPQQFHTPTRLPNSPDLLMSRRSTHVVRSPKVINIAALKKRQIEFIEEVENNAMESDQCQNPVNQVIVNNSPLHLTPEMSNTNCSVIKSETFEKEPTFLATPDGHYVPLDKSRIPITSVCAMSPKLVDYEDGSESGSTTDVTKDSLDTNQSEDSLVNSAIEANLCKEENHDTSGVVPISAREEKTYRFQLKEKFPLRQKSDENLMSKVGQKAVVRVKNNGKYSSDESEDEQFYDTLSERYYDAMSDIGNPEVEEIFEHEEADKYQENISDHFVDSGSYEELSNINFRMYRTYQNEAQGKPDISVSNETMHPIPLEKTDTSLTDIETKKSLHFNDQSFAVELSIDHRERFEVTEREVVGLCCVAELKPVDEIIRNTPEGKAKRKLRRSVSTDILLENQPVLDDTDVLPKTVSFDINPSHMLRTQSPRKCMTQSTSTILTNSAAQQSSTKCSASKGQFPSHQRTETSIKQRSKSMSNLSRQIEKTAYRTVDTKASVNMAKKATQINTKQKGIVQGIAQSRLILVKKPKTGIPRHPMLFAARNMYYDERWMEKQERGFVQWLNFVLTPPDEHIAVTSKTQVDAGTLSLENGHAAPRLAPTKEILSFRAYAARRRLNRLRRSACELYQSESFVNIIHKIEVEVESRRISLRKDKMVHADVGIKQKLLDLLLHYSSLWLRIGLETIFGEVLMLQSNQDVVGLSKFILTRLLASPDIAAEFAHPTVPHLYKEGFVAAVSRHTVKKFLLLIYFLDRAKSSRLIDHDPCLFCKDAGLKSSKEILIEFSREVLSGEGDITRHLAYLGYTVCQTQKPIDEFDFAVTNLSSDLRDGLRLCRVMELLGGDNNIMSKLRMPAISRLQKIHNTEVSFRVMSKHGLDVTSLPGTGVTARDIVDGHREKTLSLLWQLIIHFQSSIQVNEAHLQEEIDLLVKSLQLKVAMQKIGAMSIEDCQARRYSGETKLMMENKKLQLIFQWCHLVCLHYGVKVENFTVSFSDGRALCCLLHHYHPALLPLAEIFFQTTVSFQENAEDTCQIETDPDKSIDWGNRGGGLMPDENNTHMCEQLLANEKSNFKILYEKVSALGGVPLMVKFADMSNTIPDEKVVSIYVTYLCARLLDIREEVKAARIIQMAWRRRQLQKAVQKRQRRTKAVIIIQRWIRPYLAEKVEVQKTLASAKRETAKLDHSAHLQDDTLKEAKWGERKEQTLHNWWQPCSDQQQQPRSDQQQLALLKGQQQKENILMTEEEAALTIQRYLRGSSYRKKFIKKKASAIKIQALWRLYLAKKTFNMKQECLERSAVVIQKWMLRNHCLIQYMKLRRAAISLQTYWRRKHAMHTLQVLRDEKYSKAATIIQKHMRAIFLRKPFKEMRQAASVLQRYWRVKQAKKELAMLKSEREKRAAILLQNFLKSAICHLKYVKIKKSVIILQRFWKRKLAQRELTVLKVERDKAALVIQKHVRRYKSQGTFSAMQRSAVILQKTWRMLQAKKKLKILKHKQEEKSAIMIQRYYRRFKCSQEIQNLKTAVVKIQKRWRMYRDKKILARLHLEHQILAAITIQRTYRGFIQRRSYTTLKSAVIVLQKCWRMIVAMRLSAGVRHQVQENAVLVLQRNVKRWKHRRYYMRLKSAAIVLQKAWRMVKARRLFLALRLRQESSAILIQKMWRGYVAHQIFITKKRAASRIQVYWKMIHARRRFHCMREATLLIQSWHRANLETKKQRSVYLTQRKSVGCIQNWWRGKLLKKRFLTMRHSAVVIQANFRCIQWRRRFLSLKFATVIIQHTYRHHLEGVKVRKAYLTLRDATVTVQKSFRRYLQKKHEQQTKAAVVLQTVFRKISARRKYVDQKLAAQTIQTHFREYQKMRTIQLTFQHQRQAACVIQMAYRTHLLRKQYTHMRYSVIKLQSLVRSRVMRNQFKTQRNAAVIIQRKFRAVKLGQIYRKEFLLLRTSALRIQQFYRTIKAQRTVQQDIAHQHFAATRIQALYRGWSKKQDYLLLRSATVCIQRRCRSYLAGQEVRNLVRQMRESVLIIQNRWRSYRQVQEDKKKVQELRDKRMNEMKIKLEEEILENERKKKEITSGMERRMEEMRKERAAFVLQRCLRAYITLKDHSRREHAALIIQKNIRAHQTKMKYNAELKHIYQLQHLIRGFACRRRFERMKLAVRIIQRQWRELREGRRCQAEYTAKREAAVKIQAHLRMRTQRKVYLCNIRCVIIAQACVRTFIQRIKFKEYMKQIIGLQRRVRSHQQMRKDRDNFLKLRHNAIKIQTVFRLWLAYRQVRQEKSMLKMQAHFSLHEKRIAFCQASEAVQVQRLCMEMKWQQLDTEAKGVTVLTFQNSFQKYLSCQTEMKHLAAIIIQRTVRSFLDRCSKNKNRAALIIQRAMRRYMLKSRLIKTQFIVMLQASIRQFLCRRNFLTKHRLVVLLQARVRGWQARRLTSILIRRHLAAICLQAGIRGFLVRKAYSHLVKERLFAVQQQKRQHRASITIQARWRGFIIRRSSNNRKLTQARKRLEEANRYATKEKTLGSRTSSALDYLLREKDLAHILEALLHLEVSTRLSPVCCEKIVEVNAVPVLYRLINSCNRSVPHMELIKYSVNILLNLAKYENTIAAVIEPQESVSSIVELLHIYREKGVIFNNSCMLLGILGLHPGRRAQILRHALIVDRLQSIHALALRKQRTQQNRQATQAKMQALRSFNCTLPALTPSKSRRHRVQPEWALAGNNIKDFEDPVAAVTFVMDVLHVKPKM